MRVVRSTLAVVVVAAALALVGCDTTQPNRDTERTASLSLSATAIVDIYNCYEIWEDTSRPPNGTYDVDTGYKTCEPAVPPQGSSVFIDQRAVPWKYSLSISLIRAGATTEEIVGSSIQPGEPNPGIPDFVSMTDYDSGHDTAPAKPPSDTLYFVNGQQVSVGNPFYISFAGPDLQAVPNILGQPGLETFEFSVNSGDTVIVRARKQYEATMGIDPLKEKQIRLAASLKIEGVEVATNGINPPSTADDGAGFSFSFTVQ